jgi:hypothetical protein
MRVLNYARCEPTFHLQPSFRENAVPSIPTIIAFILTALFAAAAAIHLAGPAFVRRAYKDWDLPPKFHRVTGAVELLAAAFLAMPITRFWGVALAGLVTFFAEITLLSHKQYAYAVPGFFILAALIPATLAGPF